MSIVADRIRECREAANMGVDDLARIIGKNRATVYRYENGEIENYPTDVIGKLAVALGVSPGYLMGWTDIKEPQTEAPTIPKGGNKPPPCFGVQRLKFFIDFPCFSDCHVWNLLFTFSTPAGKEDYNRNRKKIQRFGRLFREA